jgi:hypothetical protein
MYYRRYQEERALPERFLGQNPAQSRALSAPKSLTSQMPTNASFNPVFHTEAQEYGKYQPNIHTRPYSYHGLSTKFTAKKTTQGNYRNHSFNL